jgi:hypothetical protein
MTKKKDAPVEIEIAGPVDLIKYLEKPVDPNARQPKALKGVKATGTFIVVERLSNKEAQGTRLTIQGESEQGFVVDVGPALEKEKWGINVGDRVLLQGTFVPVPKIGEGTRNLAIADPHSIKCVLVEE